MNAESKSESESGIAGGPWVLEVALGFGLGDDMSLFRATALSLFPHAPNRTAEEGSLAISTH